MQSPKLFMLLLGCRPPGRFTEQHDILFAIGNTPKDLVPDICTFWPEAKQKIHVDAWRVVTKVGNYNIEIAEKATAPKATTAAKLFFINLGGYKPNEFDEFHYKMIVACADKGEAIRQAKQTAFYQHIGFKGATSHVDDKYGVDVDDLYEITDILSPQLKEKYSIVLTASDPVQKEDEIHLGYFKLDKL
jgi:hypothetical protein